MTKKDSQNREQAVFEKAQEEKELASANKMLLDEPVTSELAAITE